MASLWKLGGLTPLKLTQLGIRKIDEDELSTRSAALSYYFILALFPMFLFLVSLIGLIAGHASEMRENIVSTLTRLAPGSASGLVQQVIHQTVTNSGGVKLAAGLLGALWAASGGMGAVITSLNVIYRVKERRPWWKQKLTVLALTLGLALLILVASALVLYGGKIGELIAMRVGVGKVFEIVWRLVEWPLTFFVMFLSYSLIYYFGPDLVERKWYWVTPGSAIGVVLWLVASVGFRIYLHFFNSYSATYGSLGAVIVLMLWLYITGFAILVGGEMNWVIENQDRTETAFEEEKRRVEEQYKAA